MAEPSAATVATVAIATGITTVGGQVFGLQYDALLFGLFGGLVSLFHMQRDIETNLRINPKFTMASILAIAAFCGALFSPVVPPAIYGAFDFAAKIPSDAMRLPAAFITGLVSQIGIPLFLGWFGGFMKSHTPHPPAE